jgi:MFS family permease
MALNNNQHLSNQHFSHQHLSWSDRPYILLLLTAAAMPISFITWSTLINNFTVEMAGFSGREIGILQSLRELPGFLSFLVVYLLFIFNEQRLALITLALLGFGTALTGYFPSVVGLYVTTVIASVGFHYYETCNQSLALQWLDKKTAPQMLGKIFGFASLAQVVVLLAIFIGVILMSPSVPVLDVLNTGVFAAGHRGYKLIFLTGGILTFCIAVFCIFKFPLFKAANPQRKSIILRSRYWLYYALIFMSGARRQIFVVFAGFLMVEKFGYSIGQISALFLVNAAFNIWLAPMVGKMIGRIGERAALIIEYVGLVLVFTAYAFVENAIFAAGLYLVDHMFFAMAIAIKTYFQKIADPADFAGTSSVSFTINHIVAVVLPAAFGLLWLWSPSAVFLSGAMMAAVSLLLAFNVPRHPEPGREVVLGAWGKLRFTV